MDHSLVKFSEINAGGTQTYWRLVGLELDFNKINARVSLIISLMRCTVRATEENSLNGIGIELFHLYSLVYLLSKQGVHKHIYWIFCDFTAVTRVYLRMNRTFDNFTFYGWNE